MIKMPELCANRKHPWWLSAPYSIFIFLSIFVGAGGRPSAQGEHVMTSVVAAIAGERQFQAEILLTYLGAVKRKMFCSSLVWLKYNFLKDYVCSNRLKELWVTILKTNKQTKRWKKHIHNWPMSKVVFVWSRYLLQSSFAGMTNISQCDRDELWPVMLAVKP